MNEQILLPRGQRADGHIASAIVRHELGLTIPEFLDRVRFEDHCKEPDQCQHDIDVHSVHARGSSAVATVTKRFKVTKKYQPLVDLHNTDNEDGLLKKSPFLPSLARLAPYLYDLLEQNDHQSRLQVIENYQHVADALIFVSQTKPQHLWDHRSPIRLPSFLSTCRFQGLDADFIRQQNHYWQTQFKKCDQAMENARERRQTDKNYWYLIKGKRRTYKVAYLYVKNSFDVPAAFEVDGADIIIAHNKALECTGVFTHHTLNIQASIEAYFDALHALEPGSWFLVAPALGGITDLILSGTPGRMIKKPSRIGGDRKTMIRTLQEVAGNKQAA
ncbi:hypothetical protein ACFLZY_01145 [Patescibacteria group bacterium]